MPLGTRFVDCDAGRGTGDPALAGAVSVSFGIVPRMLGAHRLSAGNDGCYRGHADDDGAKAVETGAPESSLEWILCGHRSGAANAP